MPRHTGLECRFGASLAASGTSTDFENGYLRLQNDFADAEIGDQIDESDRAIRIASLGTSVEKVSVETLGLSAREIQQCLADRYLGNCTFTTCEYFQLVSQVISVAISMRPSVASVEAV